MRALLWQIVWLLAPCALLTAAPPHIIFILADDLGYADVGFHGGEIRTPHLDRLAAAGARLDAFYGMPVCTPSRCALMTGRYPIRYGRQANVLRPGQKVGLSLDEKLPPQVLREAGYSTAHIGKWHLGEFDAAYWPTRRGFDHTYSFRANVKLKSHHHVATGAMQRDDQPCDDEGWVAGLHTQEAVRRIEQRDPAKPLFLYVAYNLPHNPVECPPEYSQPYAHLGASRGGYAGMVAQMDEGVGRIVAAVEKAGMRENTLFIFASDNGGLTVKGDLARNTTFRGGKGSLYEGGVRVAAFATWDAHITLGTIVNEPLHMVDWLPTLARLAGATTAFTNPLDGRDIWPVITASKPSPHEHLLLNTIARSGAVRVGDWKLVRNGQTTTADDETETASPKKLTREEKQAKRRAARNAPDVIELFNLATDPTESKNLANDHPDKVRELTAKLDQFAQEAVPPILKPEHEDAAKRE
jgi:arylsulfatase A-like enzyme